MSLRGQRHQPKKRTLEGENPILTELRPLIQKMSGLQQEIPGEKPWHWPTIVKRISPYPWELQDFYPDILLKEGVFDTLRRVPDILIINIRTIRGCQRFRVQTTDPERVIGLCTEYQKFQRKKLEKSLKPS